MTRVRSILVLGALALAGCFDSHVTDRDADRGPVDAGRAIDARTVRDAGSVADAGAPTCWATTAEEPRFPRVVLDDQPFAATLVERDELQCGCVPSVRAQTFAPAGVELTMALCECCDGCECVDPGYEASVVIPPILVGSYEVSAFGGPLRLEVTTRDRCRALEATGLRIVAPDPDLVRGGPAIHWAVVSGTERLCCVSPAPAVDESVGPAGEIALELLSCTDTDCPCLGEEVAFEAWHPLIELAPGTHVVRIGADEQTITIAP